MKFEYKDKIKIINTNSILDDKFDEIVGLSSCEVIDFYIVYFDKPYHTKDDSFHGR